MDSITINVIKLVIIFSVIIVTLKCKLKLYSALIIAIITSAIAFRITPLRCLELFWSTTKSWNTISVLLILYSITFLQRMLEKRRQLKLAQQNLNGIFNNRRINATLAPIFIGLLPSAAAAVICGDIVSDACSIADEEACTAGDCRRSSESPSPAAPSYYLTTDEMAFVTSYYRHIPECFLPTYSSVIIMCNLSGVSIADFVVGMIPMVIILYILGYVFYVRKLPRETGVPASTNKWKDFIGLILHLWTLIAIIILILAFDLSILLAVAIVSAIAWLVYRFKASEFLGFAKSAFEPILIVNTFLVFIFKEFLTYSGVVSSLPDFFSKFAMPTYLVFALIFFFGTIVSGSTAIITICTAIAFSAIPNSGMPLMVLLQSFSYAAMQISPTHVCLAIVVGYFKTGLGGLVKKTIPVIIPFCIIVLLYYLLLIQFM